MTNYFDNVKFGLKPPSPAALPALACKSGENFSLMPRKAPPPLGSEMI
jgi:hypothetical protein